MEQTNIYNAINFSVPAGGHPGNGTDYMGLNSGMINRTGLIAQINSYICPSDLQQTPLPFSVDGPPPSSPNAYQQSSYAGMAGTLTSLSGTVAARLRLPLAGRAAERFGARGDGIFKIDSVVRLEAITDGTSNTILAGEFARFKNDPDQEFNTWSRCLYFGSSAANSSRIEGIASSGPKINAPFQLGNTNQMAGELGICRT